MTSTTHFLTNGVGSVLWPFLRKIPLGAELYWLTYSLSPPIEVLRHFDKHSIKAHLLCCHPHNGPGISQAVWDRIQEADYTSLRALQHRPTALDGEEQDSVGLLHAKVLVWHETRRDLYGLATGSFNASKAAWERNAELVTIHARKEELVEAWDYAKGLWPAGTELEEWEIGGVAARGLGRRVDFEETGKIIGATDPARIQRPTRVRRRPVPAIRDPEEIATFADTLDDMLRNYPESGEDEQWQLYSAIARRTQRDPERREVLYIPVGVGKTFIALRWLCDWLADEEDGYVVYLVPNEWVQRTVRGHIAYVAEQAGVNPRTIEQWIHVIRPSQAAALDYVPYALVADECHNWNDGGGSSGSYTGAFDECLSGEAIPILGLSATPCRMENERFHIPDFIESFVGRPLTRNEALPAMSITSAREQGFICEARSKPLLFDEPEMLAEVKEVLTTDDGRLVAMGDYSSATLRHVWEVVAANPTWLAHRVVDLLEEHQRHRAALFLPPVGEHTDAFVQALERRSEGPVFDFRARSEESGRQVFQSFAEAEAEAGAPPILVTIDRFGEGVSVDDLDALVMLRATLSPRVAMQALGRGLRNAEDKSDCLVLDGVMFQERVDMFEKGALERTSRLPPRLRLKLRDFEDEDEDEDNDDDDALWDALTTASVLSAVRSFLRAKGVARVPRNKGLTSYIEALRWEAELEFEEFSAARLAAAIRSEEVRWLLAEMLELTGSEVAQFIRDQELPGGRSHG